MLQITLMILFQMLYAGDIPLQYNEQEGMHTEFLGNQQETFSWLQVDTRNLYLATEVLCYMFYILA